MCVCVFYDLSLLFHFSIIYFILFLFLFLLVFVFNFLDFCHFSFKPRFVVCVLDDIEAFASTNLLRLNQNVLHGDHLLV